MNRRDFLKKSGAVAASSAIGISFGTMPGCGFKGPITDPELPNIVLIIADNMGWKDPGCFGNDQIKTPNIDSLAEEGIMFTRAFVVSSSCSPSRASVITGQYPHTNGVVGLTHLKKKYSLRPWYTTLPSLLKGRGYHTAIEGKWHVSPYLPTQWYGYRERIGGLAFSAEDMWIKDTDKTVEFLKRNKDNRFYLELNYMNNHRDPYGDLSFDEDFPVDPDDVDIPDYFALPDWPEIRGELARYYSQTMKMDKMIGEVLDTLDELEIADNTIVCFLSDNGPQFPGGIMTLYDRGTATPMIIRWPKRIKGGREYDGLVNTIDLMPTFLDACGIPVPVAVQGKSLIGVLDGSDTGPLRDALFTEMTEHVYYIPARAVRTDRWKYIKNYSDNPFGLDQLNNKEWAHRLCELEEQPWKKPRVEEELYDLSKDPNEQVNLATDPDYREELEKMRELLSEHMRATEDPFLDKPFTFDFADNPEIVEPLKPSEKTY